MFAEDTRLASQPVADPNIITIQQSADPNAQGNSANTESSEIRTARDLANEMEANQNPDLRANTQPLSRSVFTEVSTQISNDSPEITSENVPNNVASEPQIAQNKVGRPKGTTGNYGPNFKPDQSLILQGKRQRTPPERFEAKSIEADESQPSDNAPRQTVIEPVDDFSKFLQRQEETQPGREQKKEVAKGPGEATSSSRSRQQ